MKMLVFTLIVLALVNSLNAYKILVVFPLPGKSHSLLGEGYVRILLKAGHEVTYITPLPLKNPPQNLRQIDVSSNLNLWPTDMLNIENLMNKSMDMTDYSVIFELMFHVSNMSINHENVQSLLLDPNETFDVVVVEWMYSELYSGFSTVFNCPFIWSSSMEPHSIVISLIDEDFNPAYNPDNMSSSAPPFTFLQRVAELWELLKIKYNKRKINPREIEAFQKAFGPAVSKKGRVLPSFDDVRYNGSLILGNSHVSTGAAVRLPQNYIPIAGYHIDEETKPLPEDLQKIMDNAKNGVIYFSLGSMVKSHSMPASLKKELLDVLGGLKQTVIWKFEEKLPNQPKNLHMLDWAPQQSILAHPNCVLFITHGGLLSTTETLRHGVPIIGIPLFADQFLNINRAVRKGFAIGVELNMDMPKNLKSAIEEMLENSKYRERAKELSVIFHDRPVPPAQSLVFWIEHVIKTRGAPHLRSHALQTPLYQKIYLDLIAVIFTIVTLLTTVAVKCLKTIRTVDLKKKIS